MVDKTIPLSLVLADAATELRSNDFEAMASAVEMAIGLIGETEKIDGYLASDKDTPIGTFPGKLSPATMARKQEIEAATRSGIEAERARWQQAIQRVVQSGDPRIDGIQIGARTYHPTDTDAINQAIEEEIMLRAERLAEMDNA